MDGPMSKLERFMHDEHGAVTIEFTTLVPAFIFMMIFFVDASVVYLTHSEMYNVARDVARRMSTGQFMTPDEVQTYAEQRLLLGERTYTLYPDFGSDMKLTVAVPVSQAAVFGAWLKPIIGRTLVATATVRREPLDLPAPGG